MGSTLHYVLKVAALAALGTSAMPAAESNYQVVENWAHFPPGMTKWGSATGVDVDSHDNVYIFRRNDTIPVIAFDKNGRFLRAWGEGMFKTAHFLRVESCQ
jgi:hypothetical protein